MEDHGTETIKKVWVEFSENEYEMLIAGVALPQNLPEFIRGVVMRSLRRKERKAKKEANLGI